MRILLLLLMAALSLLILASCGFNADKEKGDVGEQGKDVATNEIVDNDLDGDLVIDKVESKRGTNELVANIPVIRTKFLQNYTIIGKALNLKNNKVEKFIIDSSTGSDSPDFQYKIGESFIRKNAYVNAARIGRFSSHSHDNITASDLTRVSYPEINKVQHLNSVLINKKFFNADLYTINDISIYLKSSLRLKENTGFNLVRNISLNFYYYDHEKENIVLIETKKAKKYLSAGVNEIIEVEIKNVPHNLIKDNYFKRGEFIISEINNYEIPKLKTDYKTLMRSITSKSLPIVINTPLEEKIIYISAKQKKRISDLLAIGFDKKFEISNSKIKKILQFSNNLPEYKDLLDVAKYNKKGKWFVFTNKLNRPLLDYEFSNKDYLVLSYVTGDELAIQKSDIRYGYDNHIKSDTENSFNIGNITKNSEINIQLRPKKKWGEQLKYWSDTFEIDRSRCGRICLEFTCHAQFNIFSNLDTDLKFDKSFNGDLSRILLVIDNSSFSLKDLFDQKKIHITWIDDSLHIKIYNLENIVDFKNITEGKMSLRMSSFSAHTFNGVKITSMNGRGKGQCIPIIANAASHNYWPISIESHDFTKWSGMINWDKVQRGFNKDYWQHFSISISSVITNYYN